MHKTRWIVGLRRYQSRKIKIFVSKNPLIDSQNFGSLAYSETSINHVNLKHLRPKNWFQGMPLWKSLQKWQLQMFGAQILKEHLNCRVWWRYKTRTFTIFVPENPLIILENVGWPWVFGNIYKRWQIQAPNALSGIILNNDDDKFWYLDFGCSDAKRAFEL